MTAMRNEQVRSRPAMYLQCGKQKLDLSFQRLGERVVAFIDGQEGPAPVKLSLKL